MMAVVIFNNDGQTKMVQSQTLTGTQMDQTGARMADLPAPAGGQDEEDEDGLFPEDSSSNVDTKHQGSTAMAPHLCLHSHPSRDRFRQHHRCPRQGFPLSVAQPTPHVSHGT